MSFKEVSLLVLHISLVWSHDKFQDMAYLLWSETQGWSTLHRVCIPPPNLNIVPALECMTIDSRIFQHPRDSDSPLSYRSPLPWMAWILDNSSEVLLKNLIINVSFCRINHSILKDIDWSRLTEALSAHVLCKNTCVELRLLDIQPLGVEALRENDGFMNLASRGVVVSYVS